MKKLFISLILCISCCNINAQSTLPKVIPPSPEAAALFRFLDYPVNYATGVPDISVPLYEVKCGSLSLPVSISYHAAGRRVTDQTGPIGLGWSLNAGGMISRTVHGKPDEQSYFPPVLKEDYQLSNKNDYEYMKSLYTPIAGGSIGSIYESEYDIFSYYFGTESGRFILGAQRDSIYLLPLKPVKIIKGGFPSTIIDDKGVTYKFDLVESYDSDPTFTNVATGKLLSSIISANKKDTISLVYQAFSKIGGYPTETYTVIDDNSTGNSYTPKSTVLNTQQNRYTIQRLTEIRFREGKVKFNMDGASDKVSNIQIIRTDGVVLRTIQLTMSVLDHDWSISSIYNYKLDQLQIKDANNQAVENYSFAYTPTEDFNPYSRDYWGFRNGTSQGYAVPTYNVEFYTYPSGTGTTNVGSGANRTPSASYMQRGILNKIVFPTGGSTEFIYEGNMVKSGIDAFFAPGLRVRQIKTTDISGQTSYRSFKYGSDENGYGALDFPKLEMGDMSYESRVLIGVGTINYPYNTTDQSYRKRLYTSDALSEISEIVNEPVFYPEVAEYISSGTDTTGKTVYKYQTPGSGSSHHIPGYYNGPAFPGTVPNYPGNFTYAVDPGLRRLCVGTYYLWDNIPLTEKKIFKKSGNSYIPVKSVFNMYNVTISRTFKGLHLYKYLEFSNDPNGDMGNEKFGAEELNLPVFLCRSYDMTVGKRELATTVETDYTDNGTVAVTTNYTYNNNYLVSEVSRTSSAAPDLFITKEKYPFDFIADPAIGTVSQAMVTANMMNFPIEEQSYKNTVFLRSAKTHFKDWGNNIIAPETVNEKVGSGAYATRIRYYTYDSSGRVLTLGKENDGKETYLWGYKKQYPVARISGADYSAAKQKVNNNNKTPDRFFGNIWEVRELPLSGWSLV